MTKHVLIIGANSALGPPIVRNLLGQGDKVAATVSRPHKVDAFRREFPDCEPVIALDLSDADKAKSALADLIAELPRLDAVISCPATMVAKPLEFAPLAQVRDTFEVNAFSAVAIYQAAIDALRASRGRLIFTSSLSGVVASPMQGAYAASKFALEGLADTMRQECADWGVDIVLLQPGAFITPTVDKVIDTMDQGVHAPEKERALYGKLYQQMRYRAASALNDPNIMKPEAVAEVALKALNADRPETRYRVGEDANFLLGAKKEKSDREIDEMILDIYRTAPV